MKNYKTKLKELNKWDFRGKDQVINQEIRKLKGDKSYRKFNHDVKNRSRMIKGYKKIFGIDVIPLDKIMV